MQDLALVLGVPHEVPVTCVGLIHLVGVVDHADHAVGIGDGVGVVRVVVEAAELVFDVLVVGDVVEVQGQEHVLVGQTCDHVVRGDDDIVAHGPALELGVHVLVAGIGGVVDVDLFAVGLLIPGLEGFHGVQGAVGAVGDVFAPVVNVQLQRVGAAGHGDDEDQDRSHAQNGTGQDLPAPVRQGLALLAAGLSGLALGTPTLGLALADGVVVHEVRDEQQEQDDEEDDGRQGVHLGRDGLLGHVIDADGQGLKAVAGGEVADDEVVQGEGEGHDHARQHAGQDFRQLDF